MLTTWSSLFHPATPDTVEVGSIVVDVPLAGSVVCLTVLSMGVKMMTLALGIALSHVIQLFPALNTCAPVQWPQQVHGFDAESVRE